MKVLLTGTLDLLGSHVVRQLRLRGYRLRILAYPHDAVGKLADIADEFIPAKNWDRETLDKAVSGCEAIIHLGHRSPLRPLRQRYYYTAEVDANIQLVEAGKRAGIQRFVLVSTADTVGPGKRQQPATEWNEFALFRSGSAEINSRFLTESYVLEQADRGFPAVVVNPTQLIGDTDWWPLAKDRPLASWGRYLTWIPPGGGNFVAPVDAAKGVLGALERGRIGERYLLAGENLDYLDFFRLIDELTGRKPRQRMRLPRWSLLMVGQLGELWSRLRGRKGAVNAAAGRLLSLERYYDGRKAQTELKMPLTPLREALREAITQQTKQESVEI